MIPKMLNNLACTEVLLVSMRWKFKILAHRYETIVNLRFPDADDYYERIECKVLEAVKLQLEFWRHLQNLKNVVAQQFFMVHYFCIFAVGGLLYVSRGIGLNILSIAVFASTLMVMLEYFLCYHLVDSLEDVADSIENFIFELCAKMTYALKYRSRFLYHYKDHL